MVIESEVFNHTVSAFIGDVVEVNLPEWSGRMNKTYTLAELGRLKAFIAQVESALADVSVEGGRQMHNAPVEPSVPAQRDTDKVSERAQVVESAVAEDELHDFLLNVVEVADMFGVPIIWENVPPMLTAVELWEEWYLHDDGDDDGDDDLEYDWDYMDYGDYLMSISESQPLNHAGWRTHQKNWRRRAISLGLKPEVVAYELAPNIRTFEGEVYRLIHPGDFSYNDIPF